MRRGQQPGHEEILLNATLYVFFSCSYCSNVVLYDCFNFYFYSLFFFSVLNCHFKNPFFLIFLYSSYFAFSHVFFILCFC